MKCPVCREQDLLMTERQGVEIDYCPQCRGVWLDRGELDKIIERSQSVTNNEYSNRDSRSDEREYRDDKRKKQKKGSFLADFFEFGGD